MKKKTWVLLSLNNLVWSFVENSRTRCHALNGMYVNYWRKDDPKIKINWKTIAEICSDCRDLERTFSFALYPWSWNVCGCLWGMLNYLIWPVDN